MVFEEVFSRRQIEERRAADAGPAASAVQARLDAPAPGGARTLRLHVLASGSRGNAAVVEDASTGAGVLVDCGICKRDFLARCDEAGFDPARLAAILVTHDHTDHTKGLGVVLRGLAKKGIEPAVYADDAVRAASSEVRALEDAHDVRSLRAGDALSLAGMAVHVFRTSPPPPPRRRGGAGSASRAPAATWRASSPTPASSRGRRTRASCMRGCWRWRATTTCRCSPTAPTRTR
ncbi:MBL fold metallo-hydrolase [Gordonibacter pamelaeae]|uniref:MBL fold metallo-hydrolase n=1 Tax=Gordonibacter pamelaeae TaxID=471189 RepID=UPI002109ABEF|nr:MBL fold metallo-hydrolase [Gordonibacter pamelaeae]MCQ4849740.1 MBL fold metallo-hydrolase [Gordonibacter pamelaeae]